MLWRCFSYLAFAGMLLLFGCGNGGRIERVEWTVMGTVAAVQFRGGADSQAVDSVKTVFAEVERLLNAHNPDSEISKLAVLSDSEVVAKCDPFVRKCYSTAFDLVGQTGGAFNPRWNGKGSLDLGGIAKGFAVDLAFERLQRQGVTLDTLIDLGGNLRSVRGSWEVGIRAMEKESVSSTFVLPKGYACATSSECFRGKHIIDPRTGSPVMGNIAAITVIDPESAMLADGWSTALFVLGRDAGDKAMDKCRPDSRAIWNLYSKKGE